MELSASAHSLPSLRIARIALIPSTTWDGALRLLRSPTYDGVVLLRIALISSTICDGALLRALLASSPWMELCASSDHLDPLPESFGFPLPSPVWVGRFFTKLIIPFSSPISRLGWEVFHLINQVGLWFSSSVSHWVRRFFTNTLSIIVGITTVVIPLLTMHMLYDVRCGTFV